MNIRFLTLRHDLIRSMVQPSHTASTMNLALVIGTSNNLYTAMQGSDANPQSKINSIIIEMWVEKIEFILNKMAPLEKQVEEIVSQNSSEPMYFRIEYIDSNVVALSLSDLIERLDKLLLTLEEMGKNSAYISKYEKFLLYFGDKLSDAMHFPYQQNTELHQRILRSPI